MQAWVPEAYTAVRRHDRKDRQPPDGDPDREYVRVPTVPPAADLGQLPLHRSRVIICFCLSLLVYLSMVPRIIIYSNPPTGDQAFYLMVAASIVQDGDLNIANNYAQQDETKFYSLSPRPPGFVGMGAPFPLPPIPAASTNRPPDEMYDFRQPGLPLLIAPAWGLGSLVSLWWPATVIFMNVLGALLAVNIFLMAYQLTGRKWIAWAVWLPMSFSSPIMTYSELVFTEVATALMVLYAFRRLALGWAANGPLRMVLLGLCIGYIPWMSWRNLPVAAGLVAFGAYQGWRYYRSQAPEAARTTEEGATYIDLAPTASPLESVLPRLLTWAVPIATALGLLAAYNLFLFGTLTPPNRVPELGAAEPFLWPWKGGEEFVHFFRTGFALLVDRQAGLLVYAPIYLLAFAGMVAMFRSRRSADRRLLFWIGVIALPYVGLLMTYVLWSGLWGPPARFITVITPLLSAPLAMSLLALERSIVYKIIYAALALPGIFFMGIMWNDARLLWPANSIFLWLANDPRSPLRVDVWNLLPSIEHIDTLRLPANTLWTGATVMALVLLCYVLMSARRPRWVGRTLPLVAQAALWLLAIGLFAGSWYAVNAEHLKRRTVLAQTNAWPLELPMSSPQGMAYLDGKLYFADFKEKHVGVLDTTSGQVSILQPIGAADVTTYTQPTDIAVGPDNLLYVLNNGEGPEALLVMRGDGTIVRQIALEGKTPVASGIDVTADGSIYVADTVGGRVARYGKDGGQALADFSGQEVPFNNVIDVAVSENGTVYISDLSHRIFQVSPEAQVLRTYETQLNAWYLDIDGEWLDVTYDEGFLSINTKTGETQFSRIPDPAPTLAAPRGLAHAPGGKLYILDAFSRSIREFQMQR
ncbi:MAG: NHL repeat-containing protein [Chloroflexota bacterium]|nr:NHL repeat-containing protein [Chloroflexota bacterium]